MNKDESSTLLHRLCHVRDNAAYPILGHMLDYNNNQQFHHLLSPHDT